MRKSLLAIASLVTGAAAMYYLDPGQGRRRRAVVREKVGAADVANRARGLVANARRRLWPFGQPDDQKLEQRVRAQLGRLVSHPRAIETEVAAGCVRLRGRVLRHEIGTLITGLWGVPGVQRIVNDLSLHSQANGEPEWQGASESAPAVRQRTATRKVLPLVAVAVAAPVVWLAASRRAAFAQRSAH